MRKQRGFSLIELLIVVAIILVIAAIALPSLLRARIAANESSAVSSIRQIKTAEVSYYTEFPTVGYAKALSDLGGVACTPPTATSACLLDNIVASAIPGGNGKSGYFLNATGIPKGTLNADFVAGASPIQPRSSGDHEFCSTSDAIMRAQPAAGNTPVTTTGACVAYPTIL